MTKTIDDTTDIRPLRNLAQKLGLPLADLVANGLLPDQIAKQMEQNCNACPRPDECKAYLANQPGKVEKPPSFCVNGRLLTFLSRNLRTTP